MNADTAASRRQLPIDQVSQRPTLPTRYPARSPVPPPEQPRGWPLVRRKLREWSQRYLLAEIVGTLTALTVALLTAARTHSLASAALAASIGESAGFYAVIALQTAPAIYRRFRGEAGIRRCWLTARAVAAEACDYVLAESVDTLVLRPGLIYLAASWFGSQLVWGLLLGKVAADGVFYLIVIPSYEARKKLARATVVTPAKLDPARLLRRHA